MRRNWPTCWFSMLDHWNRLIKLNRSLTETVSQESVNGMNANGPDWQQKLHLLTLQYRGVRRVTSCFTLKDFPSLRVCLKSLLRPACVHLLLTTSCKYSLWLHFVLCRFFLSRRRAQVFQVVSLQFVIF